MAEGDKTFTQDELNAILAKEKNTWQSKIESEKAERLKLTNQLEEISKNAKLSDEQKAELEKQFEETRSKLMSAEEQAAVAAEKLKKEAALEREKLQSTAQLWQNRYTETSIAQSITAAAVEHQAFNPSDVVSFLRPLANLVELRDDAGKLTGQFETRIKMKIKKDDKDVEELISPSDALKLMKENTDRYGYMFRAGGKGGSGDSPTNGTKPAGEQDYSKMSYEEYKAQRDKQLGRTK